MIGFARLFGFGFVILTAIYICLSFYSRSIRRQKLRQEWDEEGMTGDKDRFVDQGLKDYDGSLRRKLILGVYVIPVVIIGTIIYVVNH
jgi:predicted permease